MANIKKAPTQRVARKNIVDSGYPKTPERPQSLSRESFHRAIMKFLRNNTSELLLLTDSTNSLPTMGLLVPSNCDLPAVYCYRLRVIEHTQARAKFTLIAENGYVSQDYVKKFRGILRLNQVWAADILTEQLLNLEFASHEAAQINLRFATKKAPEFVPTRIGYRLGVNLCLRIAFLWAYWEAQLTKWYTRTKDAVELGIVPNMEEDNFRKICKKAGLLKITKPRSKSGLQQQSGV